MDYSQKNSIFMPGLNANGPVYAGTGGMLGALPTVSPMVKFGLIGALLYLGMKKKIPMIAAGAGAVAIWQFLPSDAAAAPITANVNPDVTPPAFDANSIPMPNLNLSGFEDSSPNFPGVPGYGPRY